MQDWFFKAFIVGCIVGLLFLAIDFSARNARLRVELKEAQNHVAIVEAEKETLQQLNTQHLEAIQQLQLKNTALQQAFTAKRQSIKQVSHYDETAKNWGNTPVPDSIKRLLNSTSQPNRSE